jgi:glycine betaine/proline transport system ATP-binding protein
MQPRVGRGRARGTEPGLLLMDGRFSGRDPLIRRQMQDELVDLQAKLQKTIIFVTHDLHEALKLGDRIAIMRDGEIIQIGTPEEVVTHPADEYVKEFVQDASPAKVLTAEHIMEDPDFLVYAWEGPAAARTILAKNRREWAFMVDREHGYRGVVTIDHLDAVRGQGLDTLRSLATETVAPCDPGMYLEDIFPLAAESVYPIPVVDENGRLRGVVRYRKIFDSLSRDKEERSDV